MKSNSLKSKTVLGFLAVTLFVPCVFAQVSLPVLQDNERYSVISVTPESQRLSPVQKKLIHQLKKDTEDMVPQLLDSAMGAFISQKNLNKIFVNNGNDLLSFYKERMLEAQKNLPAEPLFFSIYVMPWDKMMGTQIYQIPILGESQKVDIDLGHLVNYKKPADFYAKINSKIRSLQLSEADKFQLQAISVHLKVSRTESTVKVQILGRLKQTKMDFVKTNDQVELKNLEIYGNEEQGVRPMTLISITQNLKPTKAEKILPDIDIQLGEFGGISGTLLGWPGLFQINVDLWKENDCHSRLNSVPALTGTIAGQALGDSFFAKMINGLVKGAPIKFRILSLKIDAESLKVSNMNLAVEAGKYKFPQCLSSETVNSKFQEEANASIEQQINSLYKQDDMTDDLMSALYQ